MMKQTKNPGKIYESNSLRALVKSLKFLKEGNKEKRNKEIKK